MDRKRNLSLGARFSGKARTLSQDEQPPFYTKSDTTPAPSTSSQDSKKLEAHGGNEGVVGQRSYYPRERDTMNRGKKGLVTGGRESGHHRIRVPPESYSYY
ncbi:hypothetical protein N656DRAFT_800002 [Canariomyces notabilis]|uniref:Uncharacterized protein n=1 Tax=Canariomyces notabilis TaxID=2074819 RepID=A0AAN6TAW4_9PEZI|nr:hypothetical protein N656DRAFT_800002 [Canariomyces arenarius]